MNRQYEVARVLTGSDISDEQITREVNSLLPFEKDKICTVLNAILQKHDKPIDEGWDEMKMDFINVASANGINEASLVVIFLTWRNQKKKLS